MNKQWDFCGWATKYNLKCSDGRTILRDAFKDDDRIVVPLVWGHQHDTPQAVLGHAMLENRPDVGVFTYCKFNNTESGQNAKLLVEHGDVRALSIYANQLKQNGANVIHGSIREVSLVLAGANPGATIENIIAHSDDFEAIYSVGYAESELELYHSEEGNPEGEEKEMDKPEVKTEEQPKTEKTVKEIYDTLNEEQKDLVAFLVGKATEGNGAEDEGDEEEDEEDMKHDVFDHETSNARELNHSAMMAVIADSKRFGSMRESFQQHSEDFIQHEEAAPEEGRGITYGITNIDYLYPDYKAVTDRPDFYKRETDWVSKVMNGVHHTPFSRIKSWYADITADEARAKGYITGNEKKEEVIAALKRTTQPTTVYKKQKLDRDDIIDITDFDVVAWIKGEMRIMLDEELARAFLIGDGRDGSSDDKINEQNIRPIWTDNDTYTIKATVNAAADATPDQIAKATIRTAVKSRKYYKGSGSTVFLTYEDVLTDMLLLEDGIGHPLYDTVEKLKTALRVREIITVPVMENQTRTNSENKDVTLLGLIVDLKDYNVGADKGGAVNMFDDFDIDFNQQKYLIETRCSGALTKPKSAIAIELYQEEDEDDA